MFGNINNEVRQKLINLMYIVFITLAFIYLPSEFVDSSKYTSLSLEQAGRNYQSKIDENMASLDEQLFLNTPLAQDFYNVMDVSAAIDQAIGQIDSMTMLLQNSTRGYNENQYLNSSKNFMVSNRILVKSSQATQLKEKIETIKQKIRTYNLASLTAGLDTVLPTNISLKGASGKERSWESFFFSKTPLAVVVTNLHKIRTDLLFTKHQLIEYLTGNQSQNKSGRSISILSTNSIAVEVLATKNFIVGDKIAFRVILLDSARGYGGVKSYVKYEGKVVKELSISQNGVVRYTPNKPGKYEFLVVDSINTASQEFAVTNLRTAFSEKNNPEVLYMGVDNPIKLQTTEFDLKALVLEIDMGEVIPFGGKYYLRFTKEGLAHLKIYAVNEEGKYLVTQRTYEVKKLPAPQVMLDGRAGGNISRKILQVQDKLTASSIALPGEEDVYNILSFEVVKVNNFGKESVVNKGKDFSSESRRLVRDLKAGDLLIIDNVRIEATDGTTKEVAPVVFSVK